MNERERLSTADIASKDNKAQESFERQGDQGRSMPEPERHDRGVTEQKAPAQFEQKTVTLVSEDVAKGYRDRWTEIQATFVDTPKDAVGKADELVAEVIQWLAQRFAEERKRLEGQWSSGSEVSTEDLRQALQHYRSFFQRLLSS